MPITQKKIGTRKVYTGASVSWMMCLRSVRESAKPITYAPMIMASPMNSKIPARTRERPNAKVAITCGFLNRLSRPEILRANNTPTSVAPNQTPKALIATSPIDPQLTAVEVPPCAAAEIVAAIMPLPIASTIKPSTSSITAPAMIETPSSESIFLRSERIRAVMPTEVAVDIIPIYMGAASIIACAKGWVAKKLNLAGKKCGNK